MGASDDNSDDATAPGSVLASEAGERSVAEGEPVAGDEPPVVLPAEVRSRVVSFAAAALNDLPEPEVPPALRPIRRFTPPKQTRLGGTALALALETDDGFRDSVADHLADRHPELVAALRDGVVPAAGHLDELAAAAYLLRSPRWREVVTSAQQEAAQGAIAASASAVEQLQAELSTARAAGRDEAAALRSELAEARVENEELRKRVRGLESALERSGLEAAAARDGAAEQFAALQDEVAKAARESEAELRRLRARLAETEAALSAARRAGRAARGIDAVRLRVLLDTLLASAQGLRRELDLPLVVDRPADTVAAESRSAAVDPMAAIFSARGQEGTDPALVDAVLTVPGLHLLVDGYNVTKTGYPGLSLEEQRNRLIRGLAGLAARNTGVELTCVFDGTAAVSRPSAVPMPRGVRVLFSDVGELADERLIRLIRSEPEGRPVAVVTNDQEVVAASRASGARALRSEALLARLERS